MANLRLQSFDAVDNGGTLVAPASLETLLKAEYCGGLVEFSKP